LIKQSSVSRPATERRITRIVNRGFDDPPKLAESMATEEEKFACYRRIRDEIRYYIETLCPNHYHRRT